MRAPRNHRKRPLRRKHTKEWTEETGNAKATPAILRTEKGKEESVETIEEKCATALDAR